MPEISVIIPVYNVEKYLRECLDSVLAQTFTDWEAICVNDGATDNSPAILTEYAAKDPRFKIVDRPNGGLSAARNTGVAHASGKYLFFLDSDDTLVPDALATCIRISEEDQLDELIFNCSLELENGGTADDPAAFNSTVATGKKLFTEAVEQKCFHPMAWLRFFKREFYIENKLHFCEGLIHEDTLFSVQADIAAARCRYISNKIYRYRIRANSIMTGTKALKRLPSYAKIHDIISKIAAENHQDPALYNALNQRLCVNAENAAALLGSLSKDDILELDKTDISAFVAFLNIFAAKQQKEYREKLDAAFAENDSLKEKLDFVLNKSLSYRIGKMITWLPKKIKGLFKHE